MILVGEGIVGVEEARIAEGRAGLVVERGEVLSAIVMVILHELLALLHDMLMACLLLLLASVLLALLGVRGKCLGALC